MKNYQIHNLEKWKPFSIYTKPIDFWYPKIPFWSTDLSLLDIQNNLMKPCIIPVPLWMLWYTRIIFFISCPWNTLVLKITWHTWIKNLHHYMICTIKWHRLKIGFWLDVTTIMWFLALGSLSIVSFFPGCCYTH